MTDPTIPPRNRDQTRWTRHAALLLILLVAAALRIHGATFGLPALNDPDEPLFMMTALDMLRSGNPNPGWFGHPATLTFYAIALVIAAVAGIGILAGRFADLDAFVAAAYADPSILFLPARLFFVACGVLCVSLTWRLGKRLGGERLGLAAAALLAVNSAHVEYSQLIRTDVQMTVFVLLATLASLDILERGRLRDHAAAGIFVGLGIATKWPAALIVLSPIAAAVARGMPQHRALRPLVVVAGTTATTLFAVSPFLLLDYATVAQNLGGEARPVHPGATGGGFLANLGWYARGPLLESFGAAGLIAAAAGSVLALRDRRALIAVVPGVAAFCLVIATRALVWERWVVPLLPFLALAAAAAICALGDWLRKRFKRRIPAFEAAAIALLLIPMAMATRASQAERLNDTRQVAAAWIRANAPRGSTILVEHAAFDLLQDGWTLRFPLGAAGCVDAVSLLAGRISYSRVETLRSGRAVVDIGHVDRAQLPSCHTDYAIFTHYQVYHDDRQRFGAQWEAYRAIAAGGRVRAVIRPAAGVRGGPVVHILELR
ncbi:ArnT family glycosyltransferase [Sphingomonas sp.]|uniref:ArnT family glycosyltransferase n=1 Tax=Sphingomonas sp. TaxID=28214 RepID=UPI002ED94E5F